MRKGIKDAIVQLRSNQLSVLYGARKKLLTYFEDAGFEERAEILDVLLTSDDSWHRREGLTLMMSVDACFYAERCAEFFDDPDRLVRIDACRRFVFCSMPCARIAVPALCRLLSRETNVDVRYEAIRALKRARDVRSLDVLQEIAQHDHAQNVDGHVLSKEAALIIRLISNPDMEGPGALGRRERLASAGELEPRVTLGMFFMESEKKHESAILDMVLRRIGQTLPDFRVVSFVASQAKKPLLPKTFSERKWANAMALSAAGELGLLCVEGRGGEENMSKALDEFEFTSSSRTKWEPWRTQSCQSRVRHITVVVRMLRESWKIADQIAENMKEVALFAVRNIELLQAYVSLDGFAEWDAGYLQRYKKAPHVDAERAADHIVAPAWFCIVQSLILYRIVDYEFLKERFKIDIVRRNEKRKSSHLAIQLAPRITEVSAEDLRVFRDLVL